MGGLDVTCKRGCTRVSGLKTPMRNSLRNGGRVDPPRCYYYYSCFIPGIFVLCLFSPIAMSFSCLVSAASRPLHFTTASVPWQLSFTFLGFAVLVVVLLCFVWVFIEWVLIAGALYENEYVKEDGKWKIKVLRYRPQWHATFEKGTNPPSPQPNPTQPPTPNSARQIPSPFMYTFC